jgi:hypothetical protein
MFFFRVVVVQSRKVCCFIMRHALRYTALHGYFVLARRRTVHAESHASVRVGAYILLQQIAQSSLSSKSQTTMQSPDGPFLFITNSRGQLHPSTLLQPFERSCTCYFCRHVTKLSKSCRVHNSCDVVGELRLVVVIGQWPVRCYSKTASSHCSASLMAISRHLDLELPAYPSIGRRTP